jgi:hypothetical protein
MPLAMRNIGIALSFAAYGACNETCRKLREIGCDALAGPILDALEAFENENPTIADVWIDFGNHKE